MSYKNKLLVTLIKIINIKKEMKEIVVISGKGGTGKTSFTASLAIIAGKSAVIADCDVDAADMHLLLAPKNEHSEDFYSGFYAEINTEKCTLCNACVDVCRFDAINLIENKLVVDEIACEGCGYCEKVCPVKAINILDAKAGEFFISKTKIDNILVHARLGIGADNSGKLVTKVKSEAQNIAKNNEIPYIIVDGTPGVGCPVIASLTGANYVVIVTEPSQSGMHNMKRAYELIQKFDIPTACIINKADINPRISDEIKTFLQENNIKFLGEFPYDEDFTKAITIGKTIVEYEPKYHKIISDIWEEIKN